jgi:hypothetical protein
MKKSILIYPSTQIRNPFPKNIIEKDKIYFEPYLQQKVSEFYLTNLKNSAIYYKHVAKGFWIKKEYCSSHPIPFLDKLKLLYKYFFYNTVHVKEAVSLVTLFGANYHHFLVEVIPLVIHAKRHLPNHLPMLIPEYYLRFPYIKSYLELLEVKILPYQAKDKVMVKNLYVFKNIQISFFSGGLIKDIRQTFVPQSKVSPSRKLFISRTKATRRKILEEEKFYQTLTEFGFEILHLEELSIKEQIRSFSDAAIVLGMHGAGLTNMVFMPPGGRVGELRAITSETSVYNVFYCLASSSDHEFFYLFGKGDHSKNKFSNFVCSVQEFRSFLLELTNYGSR